MKKGFTLIEMAIVLVILGIIIGIGSGIMVRLVRFNKIRTTRLDVDSAVKSVIGYAKVNGKLPDNSTFPSLYTKLDAYDQKLTYVYSDRLNKYNICNITNSSLTLYDSYTNSTVNNVAFMVFSKGDDYRSDTKCNGATVNDTKACNGSINTDSVKDIERIVTMDELKSDLNCGKPLRIITGELPTATVSQPYSATIYAQGGIGNYSWCYNGTLPDGMSANCSECNSGYTTEETCSLSGTPADSGTYQVLFKIKDSQNPHATDERRYILMVNTPSNGTGNGNGTGNQNNLRITTNSLPPAYYWRWYSATVKASGGTPYPNGKYRWCYSGNLPKDIKSNCKKCSKGSTLEKSCTLNGIAEKSPSGKGHPINFKVKDKLGTLADRTLSLYIVY